MTIFRRVQPGLALPVVIGIIWLWSQTFTHYSIVPLELLVPGSLLLAFLGSRVSRFAWLWWLLGFVTIFWSLAPSRVLVAGLWEALYLVAFGAGAAVFAARVPPSTAWKSYLTAPVAWFWAAQWWLLLDNLQTALALNAGGMQMLSSGSHHYTMGAQALLLIGVSASGLKGRDSRSWLAWLGLAVALYAALMSGSRGVQVLALLMLIVGAWRLLREKADWRLLLARGVLLVVLLFGADLVLAGHPIAAALGSLGGRASVQDLQGSGSTGSRLLMWDQTIRAAAHYPFGTGNASFRDVLPAFQRYASINFGSAHNYYLETLMTGGWWRLVVLLVLVLPVLWRCWRSNQWGLVFGTAGLWATLVFDITGYMPSVMTLAFLALGAASGTNFAAQRVESRAPTRGDLALRWGLTAVACGVALWWYAPCGDAVGCALGRHLAQREEVTALVHDLEPAQRQMTLETAKRLNPKSLWVDNLRLEGTQAPLERLEVLREITSAYPLASTSYFLDEARVAAGLGLKPEAIATLERGLKFFPVGSVSAGVPLRGVDPLEAWSREAPELLETLRQKP
jgi:O-antigen ligase